MDPHKLLKEFESEVNEYGGKRYDCLGNIMPRQMMNIKSKLKKVTIKLSQNQII